MKVKTKASRKAAPRPAARKGAAVTKAAATVKGTTAAPKLAARLVRIGNSRGVRLPKAVIDQANLTENVEVYVRRGQVIIQSAGRKPREGWEEQIKAALAEHGDDIEDWRDWQNMPNEFDDKEWTW